VATPAVGVEPAPLAYGHRAKVYSLGAAALCVGGTLLTIVVGVVLKAVLIDRAAWSLPSASVAMLLAAAALLVTSGFLAGWSARKLCVLEVLTAALVAGALAHAPYAPVVFSHQPWPLGVEIQVYETWAIVGTLGVGLLLFLGSSLGFMLAGGGELDLSFRYELFVALTFLRLLGKDRSRTAGVAGIVVLAVVLGWPVLLFLSLFNKGRRPSPSMLVTGIATYAVATGVIALTVVLSVMSGFELDLKKKILGTNAHAVVLKYGNDFREYQDVRKEVLAVPGVIGATPFTLNEVMVSSESNLSGVVLKGIDPQTVNSVTEIGKNVEEGDLSWLDSPAKIPLVPPDQGGTLGQMTEKLNKLLEEEDELDAKNGNPHKPRPKIEPEKPAPVKAAPPKPAVPAGPPLPGIVIGRELAHSLRVFVGDTVHVVSPLSNELGPTGPIPRAGPSGWRRSSSRACTSTIRSSPTSRCPRRRSTSRWTAR
jgi:lipoprotein-releasing system permease protein